MAAGRGLGGGARGDTDLAQGVVLREMSRQQYLLFLLLPPLLLALISGASMFGSVRFENRLVHFAYALASIVPDWLMLELGRMLALAVLRPWRPALWVLLVSGVLFASLAHAPKSVRRQRSEQKGRKGLSGEYSAVAPHVGHATLRLAGDVFPVTSCRRKGRTRRRARIPGSSAPLRARGSGC